MLDFFTCDFFYFQQITPSNPGVNLNQLRVTAYNSSNRNRNGVSILDRQILDLHMLDRQTVDQLG